VIRLLPLIALAAVVVAIGWFAFAVLFSLAQYVPSLP